MIGVEGQTIHPGKLTWNQKRDHFKRKTVLPNQQFSGNMLVFNIVAAVTGGVISNWTIEPSIVPGWINSIYLGDGHLTFDRDSLYNRYTNPLLLD